MGISFLNIDIIVRIHHQTDEPRFLIIPPLYVRLCPSSPSLKIPHPKTVTRLVVSSHIHTPPASLEIPKLFPLVFGCPLSVLAGVAGSRPPLSRYILKFLFPHHLSRQPTFVDSCAVATLPLYRVFGSPSDPPSRPFPFGLLIWPVNHIDRGGTRSCAWRGQDTKWNQLDRNHYQHSLRLLSLPHTFFWLLFHLGRISSCFCG